MKARDLMVAPVVSIGPAASLEEAARLMVEKRIGSLPVVDEAGHLRGMLTDTDFSAKERAIPFSTLLLPQVFNQWIAPEGIEKIYQAARSTKVHEVMSHHPHYVEEDAALEEVVWMMLYREVNHIPVTRNDLLVGMISHHDLLKLMLDTKSVGKAAPSGASQD